MNFGNVIEKPGFQASLVCAAGILSMAAYYWKNAIGSGSSVFGTGHSSLLLNNDGSVDKEMSNALENSNSCEEKSDNNTIDVEINSDNIIAEIREKFLMKLNETAGNGIGLYKSLEAAALVLRTVIALDSVNEEDNPMVREFIEKLAALEMAALSGDGISFGKTKVLVFEGLKGSGNQALAKRMAIILRCVVVGEVPSTLQPVQEYFAKFPEAVTSAFQHVVFYFIAQQIQESNAEYAVISDYFHSACARTLCSDNSITEEHFQQATTGNSKTTSLFKWPYDLPMANLVRKECIL